LSTTVDKKVVRDEVTMFGSIEGENSCHNCIDLNNQLNKEVIPKAEIPVEYKHHSVYDDEVGKEVAKVEKIKDIPYVKHCKIAEDEQKDCETIVGYDPNNWMNIGKARTEKFKVPTENKV
jgi:hypothetical protein